MVAVGYIIITTGMLVISYFEFNLKFLRTRERELTKKRKWTVCLHS